MAPRWGGLGRLALLIPLALPVLQACASPGGDLSRAPAAPLLWRADPGEGGGSVFLFGSVHVGTPDLLEFGGSLSRAWERSEELVVEVDLTRASRQDVAQSMLRYGLLPEGQTLEEQVSPETWKRLVEHLEARDIPVHGFTRLKPWLAGISVLTLHLQQAGLDPEHGVDQQLMRRASGGKPIVELESIDFQFSMFDSLPAEVQELVLAEGLARAEQEEETSTQLVESWKLGDEEALAELFFGEQEEHPEFASLYEKVYYERNETMSARLAEMSRDGKTRFAVIGAGHMVGPRGIPALLEERGFRVERVR